MREISAATFGVTKKEAVTIIVTPISVGAFCAAGCNGSPLVDLSPSKKRFKYVFTASSTVGKSDVAVIKVQFMGSEADKARFEIEVGGSKGGSFDMAPIKKPSGNSPREKSLNIEFEVE